MSDKQTTVTIKHCSHKPYWIPVTTWHIHITQHVPTYQHCKLSY